MAKKKRARSIHQKAFGSKRPKFAPTPKLSGGGIRVGAMMDKQLRVGMMTSPDPGNGNEINIELNAQAYCEVTTAGAESRLLPPARGFGNGQELTVMLKVDGGNLTIVGAADGNVVLEDASDIAIFKVTQAGEDENDRVWRVVHESDAMVDAIHGTTGAIDNAIIRADGTGGSDIQGSSIFISDAGWISADGGDGGLTVDANDVVYVKSESGEPAFVILNANGTDGGFHFNQSGAASAADANIFIGFESGIAITSGVRNVGIGSNALMSVANGFDNFAVGSNAGLSLNSATRNTLMGSNAGASLTSGSRNVVIGTDAMANGNSDLNVAIGVLALNAGGGTGSNVAIGNSAMLVHATGLANVAIGSSAMNSATAGSANIAVGFLSLNNVTGSSNIGLGTSALANVSSASTNIGIGPSSGSNITTGSFNLCIGNGTAVPVGTSSNQLNLANTIFSPDLTTGVIEVRRGTTACCFLVYNTFTTSTNYERVALDWASNVARLRTQKGAGGGTGRDLAIDRDDVERAYFAATETVFNDPGNDVDFRIEGDTSTHLVFVDASNNAFGIGTNTPNDLMVVSPAAIIFNDGGADIDWRIEGDTATNLFVIDAGINAVRIGTTVAGDLLDITTTDIIFNNGSADINVRMESNNLALAFFLDAGEDNIALVAANSPNFQSMVGGLFIGDATTAPTGNPTDGVFLYAESGELKARDEAGNVTTLTDASGGSVFKVNQFRLGLVTADPGADATGASTIYLSHYEGNQIALYNGSAWVLKESNEVSLALSGLTTDKNYDVFAYDNAGTLTLELSAAWSSDTARTDAIARQDGVWVKSGAATRRYIGTIRTTGTTTTEDSVSKRFVWNAYNRILRSMQVNEGTDTWTYSVATIRQANGSTANQLAYVDGLGITAVSAQVNVIGSNDSNLTMTAGVGVDSTTVLSGIPGHHWAATVGNITGLYNGKPGLGYHRLTWLERSSASGSTSTWYGDGGATHISSGITATLLN